MSVRKAVSPIVRTPKAGSIGRSTRSRSKCTPRRLSSECPYGPYRAADRGSRDRGDRGPSHRGRGRTVSSFPPAPRRGPRDGVRRPRAAWGGGHRPRRAGSQPPAPCRGAPRPRFGGRGQPWSPPPSPFDAPRLLPYEHLADPVRASADGSELSPAGKAADGGQREGDEAVPTPAMDENPARGRSSRPSVARVECPVILGSAASPGCHRSHPRRRAGRALAYACAPTRGKASARSRTSSMVST